MALDNFGVVVPGRLYRCAQPDLRGLTDLVALGVTRIFRCSAPGEGSLRLDEEVAGFGGGRVIQRDVPMGPSAEQLEGYARMVSVLVGQGPTLVHCLHGRDRTGAVVGAWRIRHDGWAFGAVMDERRLFGADALIDLTADARIVAALRALVPAAPTPS